VRFIYPNQWTLAIRDFKHIQFYLAVNYFKFVTSIFILSVALVSCDSTLKADLTMLSDEQYLDNPDIGYRSELYNKIEYKELVLTKKEDFVFDVSIENTNGKSIVLHGFSVFEMIPSVPHHLKSDEYLSYLAIINQEWNRQQVKVASNHSIVGNLILHPKEKLSRIDIARNCLNAYLWEIILFEKKGENEIPYYHGWFRFPEKEYARLFELKNGIPFEKYQKPLENWIDPPKAKINFSLLRTIVSNKNLDFLNLNHLPYSLRGERQKKQKNIIWPSFTNIPQEMLSDSTRFATFCKLGEYHRSEPRETQLSLLDSLHQITVSDLKGGLQEIRLDYPQIRFYIGGIDLKKMPVLEVNDAHKGWQNSMGFGNHSFYETYDESMHNKSLESPYYGLISNLKGEWLDSHKIGIDGPLLHLDKEGYLHIWILSFERHAFVGHYKIKI
jgi:hypothetical protein